MRLVVFGATGGVGRHLVEFALARNYWVTAAIREPTRLMITHPKLQIAKCDVYDSTSVGAAVAGQDVVLCALGSKRRVAAALYSQGARNIVQQMQQKGVRRIVFLSNFGVLDEKAEGWRQRLLLFSVRRFLRDTLEDHRKAIDEICQQAPEWIITRPMLMNNHPSVREYRVAMNDLPPLGTHISRAAVADFMLRQVESEHYLRKIPSIAY